MPPDLIRRPDGGFLVLPDDFYRWQGASLLRGEYRGCMGLKMRMFLESES